MKYKLITGIAAAASLLAVSCKNDEVVGKNGQNDLSPAKQDIKATEEVVSDDMTDLVPVSLTDNSEAQLVFSSGTKFSKSLDGVAKALEGGKFVPAKIDHKADYYVIYFTASW